MTSFITKDSFMTFENFKAWWAGTRETFPHFYDFSINLIAAIIILTLGWMVAGWMRRRVQGSRIGGRHVDSTLRPVIASSVFYVVIAMTIYAFLRKLGVDAASLLAVFGAAGLAIGLALKDTLSNIAAGVMMLVLRPLKVGEFIDTPNFAGTVQELGLFSTMLTNIEGLYIYVPNGQVWNSRLTNFGRHTQRKAMIDIGVGYDTDLEKAKTLLLKTMDAQDGIINTPTPPEVYVMSFGDSAINLSCRCLLPADNWLKRASDLRIAIKGALDENGIEIPFPQRVVTTVKAK